MLTALLVSMTLMQVPVPGGAEEQERFKVFFTRGESLYGANDYGPAIWNFRKADTIRLTPEVAYDLAKCHEKLGDVAFTTFYYRQYLKRAPNASDALDVAERIGTVLAQAEAEGRGLLEVVSPGAEDVVVAGKHFAEAPAVSFLPPGEFEVSARFPSGVKTMMAQIRTGKTTTVSFEPMPPPMLDAQKGLSDELMVGASAKGPGPSKMRVASYVTFGVGLAALAAGIGLGISTANDAARLQTDKSLTPSEAEALAQSANTRAVIANTLMIGGGAAAAGGVVMFIFSMPEPGMKKEPSGS